MSSIPKYSQAPLVIPRTRQHSRDGPRSLYQFNTALSHGAYPRIRYMERVTTCGCHFICQPLSVSILILKPLIGSQELLTHLRYCIQQTSSVGGKDFSPQTFGLLQVLYRTNPEAYELFAVVLSL